MSVRFDETIATKALGVDQFIEIETGLATAAELTLTAGVATGTPFYCPTRYMVLTWRIDTATVTSLDYNLSVLDYVDGLWRNKTTAITHDTGGAEATPLTSAVLDVGVGYHVFMTNEAMTIVGSGGKVDIMAKAEPDFKGQI